MESKVAAGHEVYHEVPVMVSNVLSQFLAAKEHTQILNVLEAVAQIAEEGMPQMLQHSSLAYNVPYTL